MPDSLRRPGRGPPALTTSPSRLGQSQDGCPQACVGQSFWGGTQWPPRHCSAHFTHVKISVHDEVSKGICIFLIPELKKPAGSLLGWDWHEKAPDTCKVPPPDPTRRPLDFNPLLTPQSHACGWARDFQSGALQLRKQAWTPPGHFSADLPCCHGGLRSGITVRQEHRGSQMTHDYNRCGAERDGGKLSECASVGRPESTPWRRRSAVLRRPPLGLMHIRSPNTQSLSVSLWYRKRERKTFVLR